MQGQQIDYPDHLTLYLDDSWAFNRGLLSLIKQWDRKHTIDIHTAHEKKNQKKSVPDEALKVVDQNGISFQGVEAVPIILKNLPFGKVMAAIYILPGTMWITKQLYR